MSKKLIAKLCITGFFFVTIMGAIGHFVYEWSGYSKWAGILFAVNESTWEHIKLTILPTVIVFTAAANYSAGDKDNFAVAFFAALLIPILVIPALFYAYTALIGRSIVAVDIGIFVVSVALPYYAAYRILTSPALPLPMQVLSVAGIVIILICYMTLTVLPLQNIIFKDPVSGGYGLRT